MELVGGSPRRFRLGLSQCVCGCVGVWRGVAYDVGSPHRLFMRVSRLGWRAPQS